MSDIDVPTIDQQVRLRTDGRWEISWEAEADRRFGCSADNWCILTDQHPGECEEDRESLAWGEYRKNPA